MVNNLVIRWPKPLFFMEFGDIYIYSIFILYIYLEHPGTLNNQLFNGWMFGETTHFPSKGLVHHPLETTIKQKGLFSKYH